MSSRNLLVVVILLSLFEVALAGNDFYYSEPSNTPPPCDVYSGFSIAQYPLCRNDMLLFINSSWNAYWYQWYCNGVMFSTEKHPEFQLTTPGVHKIELVAGDYNCSDTSEMWIDVNDSYFTMMSAMICPGKEYDFFGKKLTAAGLYTTKLVSINGCDSIIHLFLEVDSLQTGFTYSAGTATAGSGNTYYQWMMCKNGYIPVSGATTNVFQPSQSGMYALVTSNGVCTDTSECFKMVIIDTYELTGAEAVKLSPNPAKNFVRFHHLSDGFSYEAVLISPDGRQRLSKVLNYHDPVLDIRGITPGVYIVKLISEGRHESYWRLVVE